MARGPMPLHRLHRLNFGPGLNLKVDSGHVKYNAKVYKKE